MPTIIAGQSKVLIVRIADGTTGDPYDLTGTSLIEACFTKTDGTNLDKYYLALTADTTSASDVLANVSDTSKIQEGQPISGPGIPAGTVVLKCPNSATSPTPAGQVQMSHQATATATGAALTFGDVSIVSAVIGKIKIALSVADTDLLEQGSAESFQVTIVNQGVTSVIQFTGVLNVEANLCP